MSPNLMYPMYWNVAVNHCILDILLSYYNVFLEDLFVSTHILYNAHDVLCTVHIVC